MTGSCQRRNGLVASSFASVVGSVGLPAARRASISFARSFSAELVGSTDSANLAGKSRRPQAHARIMKPCSSGIVVH